MFDCPLNWSWIALDNKDWKRVKFGQKNHQRWKVEEYEMDKNNELASICYWTFCCAWFFPRKNNSQNGFSIINKTFALRMN